MVFRGEGKGGVVFNGMNDDLLAGRWYAGLSGLQGSGPAGVSRRYRYRLKVGLEGRTYPRRNKDIRLCRRTARWFGSRIERILQRW